jgi:hypothetical protein
MSESSAGVRVLFPLFVALLLLVFVPTLFAVFIADDFLLSAMNFSPRMLLRPSEIKAFSYCRAMCAFAIAFISSSVSWIILPDTSVVTLKIVPVNSKGGG